MAASRRGFLATALGAFATVGLLAGMAEASTPPLAWAGAKRLHIMCNVAGGPGIDQAALGAQLCGEVKRLAVKGAPVPVDVITLGDPAAVGCWPSRSDRSAIPPNNPPYCSARRRGRSR